MRINHTQFAMIPTWVVLDPSMVRNPTRIAVYAGVRVIAFEFPGKEWPSERELADDVAEIIGVGAECIRKHLRAMRQARIVLGNAGELRLPADKPDGDQNPQDGDVDPQSGDHSPHAPLLYTEDKESPSSDDEDVLPGFDTFWNQYPRKVEKTTAKKAYAKALKNSTPSVITLAASREKERWEKTPKSERRYFKHPATWLNKGCWEDEIESGPNFVEDRARNAFTEAGPFFGKYGGPEAGRCMAVIRGMLIDGYDEGETLIRMAIALGTNHAQFVTVNFLKAIKIARFEGRPQRFPDLPDEPIAENMERAMRSGRWVQNA